MSTLSVRVANPFLLKGSLEVALEVARMDLAVAEVEAVRDLLVTLPHTVRPADLHLALPQARAVLLALRYFAHSRTRYWLREEMVSALRELERTLVRHLQDAAGGGSDAEGPQSLPP
ncbi:hypothetical protein J2Z79_003283 [Symbiobacterium terraclitae]|uniref:Uncharacterized protein n=1 Tax=Symbiobacterium terraclitae TaxID=557451 RepID=A0ABS4JWF0_9FIRM|nr:hypothetical protein [Symbiobacterium terraclitae]MBP2019841.1 hypothetical protein [Symbiobacterium terraclitae]